MGAPFNFRLLALGLVAVTGQSAPVRAPAQPPARVTAGPVSAVPAVVAPVAILGDQALAAIQAIAEAPRPSTKVVIEPAFTFPAALNPNISRAITAMIDSATQEVLVDAYAITDADIARALTTAQTLRGLTVLVILEPTPAIQNYRTPDFLFRQNVITVFSKCPGFNNNSFIVIDRSLVITGSYQFTQSSATANAENVLFLRDPKTAMRYYSAFAQHLNAGVIPANQLAKEPATAQRITEALTRTLSN